MKFSKAEKLAAGTAAAFVLFFAGWFLRGRSVPAGTYTVSTQYTRAETSPLPSPSYLPDERLDLNTATQEDLEGLPGIGAVRAAAILSYRDEHGPFRYPEDLTRVPGIGQATYNDLADYVMVKEAEAP